MASFEEDVLSRLESLGNQSNENHATVAVLASTVTAMGKMFERHDHTIFGNGRPGLTTAVETLEEKVGYLIKFAWGVGSAFAIGTAAVIAHLLGLPV